MRKSIIGLACGLALALTAAPAVAQEGSASGEQATPVAPMYRVEMLRFKADDESGWDRLGSDEPYWVVSSVGPDGSNATRRTRTFQDVDSGDQRSFSGADRCVYPINCTAVRAGVAPGGIGVSIQLIEADSARASEVTAKLAAGFRTFGSIAAYGALYPDPEVSAGAKWVSDVAIGMGDGLRYVSQWLADDPIGTQTIAYEAATLAKRLPQAGMAFTEAKYFGGLSGSGGADYTLRLRVTRTR